MSKQCDAALAAVRRQIGRIAVYAVVGAGILHSPFPATGADWPYERGDANASGASEDVLPSSLEVVWTYQAEGSGFESVPVIVGGVIYIGDYDGTMHAVQLSDGTPKWTKSFEQTGFLSAAAVAFDRVFIGDFNGVVRSLSADTGDELWSYETNSEVFAAPNYVAETESVLVTTEGGQLIALSSSTGDKLWQEFEIEAPLRCWPTVVDGKALLAGCDGRAHAVDVKTGKEVDSVEIDGPTGATPAVLDGDIYFGTEEGSFLCLSSNPLNVKWHVRDSRSNQGVRAAAAVSEQAILYSSQGKHLFAINPKSGEPLWTFSIRSRIDAAATISGSTAYFGTSRGRVFGVDLASGKETWNFEAGGKFLAAPAVSDSRLVIGNEDGTLYCFGESP